MFKANLAESFVSENFENAYNYMYKLLCKIEYQ